MQKLLGIQYDSYIQSLDTARLLRAARKHTQTVTGRIQKQNIDPHGRDPVDR